MADKRISGGELAAWIVGGWVGTLVLRFVVRSFLGDSERLAAGINVGIWIVWIAVSLWLVQRWLKTAPTVPPVNR